MCHNLQPLIDPGEQAGLSFSHFYMPPPQDFLRRIHTASIQYNSLTNTDACSVAGPVLATGSYVDLSEVTILYMTKE